MLWRVVAFIICLGVYLIACEIKFTNALTEEQKKTIEKLRSELNEAFEEHEEQEIAAKGVILQPEWTQNSDAGNIRNAKVEVTKAGLDEAKALRDEINAAKERDMLLGNSQQVQQLEQQIASQSEGKEILSTLIGDAHVPDQEAADIVGANEADDEAGDVGPNVVEAQELDPPDIDVRKLQRLELSKRRTREMLVLNSIEEDFSFKLGADVEHWEHITHAGREYIVGRRQQDLIVVQQTGAAADAYHVSQVLEVGAPIAHLQAYTYWHVEQQQQVGVVLVASGERLLWFTPANASDELHQHWQWRLGNAINGVTHFQSEAQHFVAICSEGGSSRAGHYTLNVYQYTLGEREFWIAQRLQLAQPCREVAVLDTGRELVLAVPQNDSVVIYISQTHADASGHLHFELRRRVESEGVQQVAAFEMGGRTYLAVGGRQPQILQHQQGDFVPKTILGQNFGLVERFLAVPARTYRDDLLLFVQHSIDFDTHRLQVLETLIWNGDAFEASIPVPCRLGAHITHGASCMLDQQRPTGMLGATLLRRGEELALLVPRHQVESGLFRLQTQLLAKNSELLDLQDIYEFMQDWVKEQDDLVAQAQHFLSATPAQLAQMQPDYTHLELLETPLLQFNGEVGEIHLNDYTWTEQDTQTDLDMVLQRIEQLEASLSGMRQRRDTRTQSYDTLVVDEAAVEELLLTRLNDAPFYIQNGELNYPQGWLNLRSLVVLEEERVLRKRRETIFSEPLVIEGDVQVKEINNMPWDKLHGNLLFKTDIHEIDDIAVDGEVIIQGRLSLDRLSELKFPEDFLFSTNNVTSVVNATKSFEGAFATNVLETGMQGTINDVNPRLAITLSQSQVWAGEPNFAHLEILEVLEDSNDTTIQLPMTAESRAFGEAPENPTLQEAKIIAAACHFEQLQVLNGLHVRGTYNDQPLPALLEDVAQRQPDARQPVLISGKKTFGTVEFPIDLQVADAAVNGIGVQQFVTLHTTQQLSLSPLAGFFFFDALNVSGAVDGIRIEQLLDEAIRIDQPQELLQTQLNFFAPLTSDQLEVTNELNGVAVPTGFQTLNESLQLPVAYFDSLQAQTAHVTNGVQGTALLNGINLQEFLNADYATVNVGSSLFLQKLVLGGALQTDRIHGIEASNVLQFLDNVDELSDMIIDGKVQVDHVIVRGDVQLNKLNGQHFDEDVQFTIVWLNRPNYLSTHWSFATPLQVHGALQVEAGLNGVQLPMLLADVVFRRACNGSVQLLAPKSFVRDVHVRGNTRLQAINGVPMQAIATKRNLNHFAGSLLVQGNLLVPQLEVSGFLNTYSVAGMNSLVRFDPKWQAIVLVGEVPMQRQQLLDLTVHGDLNGVPQLDALFGQLLHKEDVCVLHGNNVFTGRVNIQRGATVYVLNGRNIKSLLQQLVFVRGPAPIVVQTPVVFSAPVRAANVIVHDTLSTAQLTDCVLDDWLRETLRVDQAHTISTPLRLAANSLDGNSLTVEQLNQINLSHIITLHTPQQLAGLLRFSVLYLDGRLETSESVNGVHLAEEYANTLLTHGNQHVTTPLTMQSLNVLADLQTNAPINGDKDLRQIATLHEDLEFESPLYFQNLTASNLVTQDLVSGINIERWYADALWLRGRPEQRITGSWRVGNLTVRSADLRNSDLERNKRYLKSDAEMCYQLNRFLKQRQRRNYYLRYLHWRFEVHLTDYDNSESNVPRHVYVLKNGPNVCVLSNNGCWTDFFWWNVALQEFEFQDSVDTGVVEDLVVLTGHEDRGLMINSFSESALMLDCPYSGLNLWHMNDTHLTHSTSYERPVLLLGSLPRPQADKNNLLILTGNTFPKLRLGNLTEMQPISATNTPLYQSPFALMQSEQMPRPGIVNFEAGLINAPHNFYAFITTTDEAEPHYQIHVFEPDHDRPEIIIEYGATEIRNLTVIRVRDETLLAHVEGCCTVRVLIYRGVEGFVLFNQFTLQDLYVRQLLTMLLPSSKKRSGKRHILGVVLDTKIAFYEFRVDGIAEPSMEKPDYC